MSANPLKGWKVNPAEITLTGTDLRRPECVLAEKSGDLWVADIRGGVMHIRPDGSQEVITPKNGGGPFAPEKDPNIDGNQGFSMPNGLCFDENGDFYICNFGTNRVEHLTRKGDYRLILDQMDGKPLGKTNFPMIDSKGRLWFTVTATAQAWADRNKGHVEHDGYLVLVDDKGPRVVAEPFGGTNELRFDDNEEWLYVAETGAGHMTRLKVAPDGSITEREVYGPKNLGGNPDGFAFDSYGNLWTTLIAQDTLAAITPEGEVLILWEDGDREVKRKAAEEIARTGKRPTGNLAAQPGDGLAPRMASITFGGPDLCTVYIGSLQGKSLPTFRSPVPGKALSHWDKTWS